MGIEQLLTSCQQLALYVLATMCSQLNYLKHIILNLLKKMLK